MELITNSQNNIEAIEQTLNAAKEYTIPQVMFSKGDYSVPIRVMYISDLHLVHHITNEGIDLYDTTRIIGYLDKIVKQLLEDHINFITSKGVTPSNEGDLLYGYYYLFEKKYSHLSKTELDSLRMQLKTGEIIRTTVPNLKSCVCFIGDISSDISILDLFFARLELRLKFYSYKNWKEENYEHFILDNDEIENEYNELLRNIDEEIIKYKQRIVKIENKFGKKNLYNRYSKKGNSDIIRLINNNKDLPDYLSNLVIKINRLLSYKEELVSEKEEFFDSNKRFYVNDFVCSTAVHCPFFFVLGNHELSEYYTIEEAVKNYKRILSKYNVVLLQNETVEYDNCIIVGGTAFAKYNDKYNADTIIGPGFMSHNRKIEAEETERFNLIYINGIELANRKNKPLIVFSHFAVSDWLNEATRAECYYFHGHNHKNSITINDFCHIYADNQIGYSSGNILLKMVLLGTCYNPFINLDDGYYEITSKQYQDYYNYCGEFVTVQLIQRQIERGETLYLIKRNGYYGFFMIGKKITKICYGGRYRIISDITDIRYFYDTFCLMIYTFLQVMLPFRKWQEQIAEEVQSLGLLSYKTGNIHGTIVDVDYYHHIMINPFDASITFYYSPVFGMACKFDSFEELLSSVVEKTHEIEDCEKKQLIKNVKGLASNSLLVMSKQDVEEKISHEMEHIDIKNSMYSVSRRVNQLQRLFTLNILREWNDDVLSPFLNQEGLRKYALEEKKLTPYNMIQKHWKNILLLNPDEINEKLVRCALKPDRRIRFPYLKAERRYGYTSHKDKMSDEQIKEYIQYIPRPVLINTFADFYRLLGNKVLLYYPLELLKYEDISKVLSRCDNKTIIWLASQISYEEWTDSFGESVRDSINLKNKPSYCSSELWRRIRNYNADKV